MTVFGAEHIFDQFERNGPQIHIGLDQCIINRLTCVRFKQLTFKLEIADRHKQFLSSTFSTKETEKGILVRRNLRSRQIPSELFSPSLGGLIP